MDFIIANDSKAIEDNLRLRYEIFCTEMNENIDDVFDYLDQISYLFNIYEDDKIIATSRVKIENGIGIISFLGVFREARGMGVGSFLVNSIFQYLEKYANIYDFLLLTKKETLPFFQKNGFIIDESANNINLIQMKTK